MTAESDSFIGEYAKRYSAQDADGVTELCLSPFLAIRGGAPIHLANETEVHDHFVAMMDAYRDAGYVSFVAAEIDTRELGEHAAFATVRWHGLDADGNVARESLTTYHVLATPAGLRFLSYTNHF